MEIGELISYSGLHVLRFIIIVTVLIKFINQSSKHKSSKCKSKSTLSKEFKFLKNTTLINILSILCGSVCTGIIFIIKSVYFYVDNIIIDSDEFNYDILKYTRILQFTFYTTGVMSLELFLLCQLYTTFEKTTHAISRNTLKIFFICIICQGIFSTNNLVLFSIEPGYLTLILLGVNVVLTIVICSIISFMFSNRLFKIMINLRQSIINNKCMSPPSPSIIPSISSINDSMGMQSNPNTNSNININININISLSDRQVKLLKTITKHTVLILFITIMLSSYFICYFILYHFDIKNKIIVVFLWYITRGSLLSVPICLWLSFTFAKKEYNFVCNQCHSCCFRCFECFAMQKLEKKYLDNNNNNQDNCNHMIDLQVYQDRKNDTHLMPN